MKHLSCSTVSGFSCHCTYHCYISLFYTATSANEVTARVCFSGFVSCIGDIRTISTESIFDDGLTQTTYGMNKLTSGAETDLQDEPCKKHSAHISFPMHLTPDEEVSSDGDSYNRPKRVKSVFYKQL